MKQIFSKILLLLCLTALVVSAPGALATHDPTAGTYTQVAADSRDHPFQIKWFSTEKKSTTDIRFVYGYITGASTKTVSTLDLTAITVSEYVVKAISQGLRCFILHKNTASGQQLNAYLYPTSGSTAPTARLIAAAANATINPAAALPNQFSVNDDCTAFRYGALSFHWSGSAWVADTIAAAWTNPVFNNDHSIAVSDDAIYTYATNAYTKNAIVETFNTKKKVYSTTTKMVVFSWKTGTGTDATNTLFKLNIYSISGTTFTLIKSQSGTALSIDDPKFLISQNLQNIVIHYKSTATGNPYTFVGRVVNYAKNTVVDIQTHAFLKEGVPNIFVSDRYLYAIRTVDVSSKKQHQPFLINGGKLVPYSAPLDYGATTYTRVLLQNTALNQLNVIYQRMNSNVYTLQKQLLTTNLELTKFNINRQTDGTTVRTLTTPIRQPKNDTRVWYIEGNIAGAQKVFQYNAFIGNSLTRNSKKLADTYTTKAKSVGKTCLVLHDSAGTPKVQVWDLNTHNPSATKKDITSKVTMANIATTIFQITDDCGALRIDNKMYHWVSTGTADYYEDEIILPSVTVPIKPVFSNDGKYMISNNGIFVYTPRNGSTAGKFTLQRNDTFYDNKQIFIDTNSNLVIWSWAYLATNSFAGKVQVNYKGGTGTMRVITETGGSFYEQPKIVINQKFNRIIIWGANRATTYFYAGLFIDWRTKIFKTISLPEQITNTNNQISITQNQLYVRNVAVNAATGYKKHYAYSIQGNTLIRLMDDNIYTNYITAENTRGFIGLDTEGKLLITYQYYFSADGLYQLIKDVRTKPVDVIFANKLPVFDLTFAYTTQTTPVTDFFSSSTIPFGRYAWLDSASKLNYLQYTPQNTKIKNINVTAATALATGYTIKATSPSKDCIIVRKATFLKVFFVNLTASPAVITQIADIQATVIAGGISNDAAIDTAITADLKVSDKCQKVKIDTHIYYKSGTTYTKNTKGSGLTSPVFDSNLNFSVDATKVYRWNTTSNDYTQPITNLSGLKTTKTLYLNQNQTKLLLFTQQANGTTYEYVAKLWTFDGNSWNEVLTIPSATTTSGVATVLYSPDFETIGIVYEGPSSALGGMFAKVNYTTLSLTTIPIPVQWTTAAYQLTPRIILANNYLYYRSNKAGIGNVRAQITYRIDKVANKFVQLNRRDLTPEDITALAGSRIKNILVNQTNDLITLIYEIHPASPVNTVQVSRRDMGSANTQTLARNIEGDVVVLGNTVYPCPSGCKKCNDPQNCALCQDSFVLEVSSSVSTGRCLKCKADGCATCTDGVVSTCSTCLAGKYKDTNNLCVNCHSSCLTCDDAGTSSCLSCKIGFYLTGGKICLACSANCNVCSSTGCTTCKIGYVWDSTTSINGVIGNCVKCIAGCANCKADKIFQCTNSSVVAQSCGTDKGFEPIIVNNTNTGCKICPTYCKKCADGICSVCRDNYLLINGKCIQKCTFPCQTCNAGFPSQCTSCIGGYTISQNSCNPDISCNSGSSCTACPVGYNLMSGICVKCQGGANCQSCLSTSSTTCVSCLKGYYFNPSNSICIACDIGCATCNNDATCLTCLAGYYIVISSNSAVTANGKCLKCDDSCLSCQTDAFTCDVCASAYKRNGFKCQGNYRVDHTTKYDTNFSGITNAHLTNINKLYCNAVGLPLQSCTINSVKQGSVIVSGSITTTQSSVPTVAASLSAAIKAGTSVDGLTVIGSSITSVTTTGSVTTFEDNSIYYKNIAIIVGIVIPIGIIILLIIIIVLIKKGLICVESQKIKVFDGTIDELKLNQDGINSTPIKHSPDCRHHVEKIVKQK